MARLLRVVVVTLLILTRSGVAAGQSPSAGAPGDSTSVAWAKRLLVAMHAPEALLKGIDSAFASERNTGNQRMPTVFFDSLSAHVRRVVPQLIDSLATLYAGQVSLGDLKELVLFYESPLGQRYAGAQVVFEQRSKALAQRWGMRVAIDVMKDLLDKGLISDVPH